MDQISSQSFVESGSLKQNAQSKSQIINQDNLATLKLKSPSNLKFKNDLNLVKYKFHQDNHKNEIRMIFLDRFKQKKERLLQNSSIYFDIKMKKPSDFDKKNLVSLIKQSSLQKLPSLSKKNRKYQQYRLSQTIDAYNSANEDGSLQQKKLVNCSFQSTIQVSQISKARMHLQKRCSPSDLLKSSNQIQKIQNNSSSQKPRHNKSYIFESNEQSKKKFLKGLVDRYFSNENERENNSKQKAVGNRLPSYNKSPKVNFPLLKQKSDHKNRASNERSLIKESGQRNPNIIKQSQQIKNISQIQQSSEANKTNSRVQNIIVNDQTFLPGSSFIVSLNQSYVLQKIQEDIQWQQENQFQDFYSTDHNSNILSKNFKNNSSIRSLINQTPLSPKSSSSLLITNQSLKDLLQSQLQKNNQKKPRNKQSRKLIFQNRSFVVHKIRYENYQPISYLNDLMTLNVEYQFRKTFKSQNSMQLKFRQIKAKRIIQQKFGSGKVCPHLWQEDLFEKNCIKMNLTKTSPPSQRNLPLTLSRLLLKTSSSNNNSFCPIVIKALATSQKHSVYLTQQRLLQNRQQNLLKFLLNISYQLGPLSETIINNKISLNNIFLIDQNKYAINEWSYSYICESSIIQSKKFQKRFEPVLKNQFNDWFVTPEYLAPEILENLVYSPNDIVKYWKKVEGKKMEKHILKENDLFQFGNKSDVWSLGIITLQIITLIPVWIGQKCFVQNRNNPQALPRKGFLYNQNRDLLKILTKQSYLKENLNKILRVQSQPYELEDWLVRLLHRMLQLDPKKRVSFNEIIKILEKVQVQTKQRSSNNPK